MSFGANALLSAEFVSDLPFRLPTTELLQTILCKDTQDLSNIFAKNFPISDEEALGNQGAFCKGAFADRTAAAVDAWTAPYLDKYKYSLTYIPISGTSVEIKFQYKIYWLNQGYPQDIRKTFRYRSYGISESEVTVCKDPNFMIAWDDPATINEPIDKCLKASDIEFKLSQDNSCPWSSAIPALGSGLTTSSSGNACIESSTGTGALCYMESDGNVFKAAEGSCYGSGALEPQPYPDNPFVPPTETCSTMSSGGLVCPADPADYCDANGVCTPNCGYVEGSFYCFPIDANGDGVPDNDVDGDGLPDVDQNQNGIADSTESCDTFGNCYSDTPTTGDGSGDGSGSGSGSSSSVEIDMSGVEAELKKIAKSLTVTESEKGSFDLDAVNAEIATAQTAFDTLISKVKSEAGALIPSISSSAGSFAGCSKIASVGGTTHSTCFDNFSDEMKIIANAIFFMFVLLSAFIILRSKN